MRSRSSVNLIMTLLAGGLFACASNQILPKNVFILPISAGPELMKQCSRDTPQNVTEFWELGIGQVDDFDHRIDDFFYQRHLKGWKSNTEDLKNFHRQYLGIVTDGKRLIYGSFYDPIDYDSGIEAAKAQIWCDGGPDVFGLEYDPTQKKILDMQMNGPI